MQALRFHFFKDSVKVEVLPVHLSIEKRGLFFSFLLNWIPRVEVLLGKVKQWLSHYSGAFFDYCRTDLLKCTLLT